MAVPTLTYNCENWTLNRTNRQKTEVAEMKFLRNLAGYKLINQKFNTDIRSELTIYHLGKKIEHRK
jgi:hypothetical protein